MTNIKHIITYTLILCFNFKKQIVSHFILYYEEIIYFYRLKLCISYMYMCVGMMESLHNELRALNSAVVSTTVCPYFIETNPEISKHLELRYTSIMY